MNENPLVSLALLKNTRVLLPLSLFMCELRWRARRKLSQKYFEKDLLHPTEVETQCTTSTTTTTTHSIDLFLIHPSNDANTSDKRLLVALLHCSNKELSRRMIQ